MTTLSHAMALRHALRPHSLCFLCGGCLRTFSIFCCKRGTMSECLKELFIECQKTARQTGIVVQHKIRQGATEVRPQGGDKASGNGNGNNGASDEHRKGNWRYRGKPGNWARERRKAQRTGSNKARVDGLVEAQVDLSRHLVETIDDIDYTEQTLPWQQNLWSWHYMSKLML